jgi:hypothetical protein
MQLHRYTPDAVSPTVAAMNATEMKLNTGGQTDLADSAPMVSEENLAFSWAIATLVGECRNIVCSGDLAEEFQSEASADPRRRIFVREASTTDPSAAGSTVAGDTLFVSINEVHQSSNFQETLRNLANLGDRVIIAINGRVSDSARSSLLADRAWMAGEFHWILRAFWNSVIVYTMPTPVLPQLEKSTTGTEPGPFVAICEEPLETLRNGG